MPPGRPAPAQEEGPQKLRGVRSYVGYARSAAAGPSEDHANIRSHEETAGWDRKEPSWLTRAQSSGPRRRWNPVTGCSKVSPGCAHCYAETFAERWRGVPGHPYEQGFDLRLWPQRLEQPLRWRRPRMIFVNSMSDLFHEDDPGRASSSDVFDVMGQADWHTSSRSSPSATSGSPSSRRCLTGLRTSGWASRSRTAASSTAPTTCARCRPPCASSRPSRCSARSKGWTSTASTGSSLAASPVLDHRRVASRVVRELRDRCASEGVAFFFKQWGGVRSKTGGRLLDGRTWDEMPTPRAARARMTRRQRRAWGYWTQREAPNAADYLSGSRRASQGQSERIYLDAFAGEGNGRRPPDRRGVPRIRTHCPGRRGRRGLHEVSLLRAGRAPAARAGGAASSRLSGPRHRGLRRRLQRHHPAGPCGTASSSTGLPPSRSSTPTGWNSHGARSSPSRTTSAATAPPPRPSPSTRSSYGCSFQRSGIVRTLALDEAKVSSEDEARATRLFGASSGGRSTTTRYERDRCAEAPRGVRQPDALAAREVLGYRFTHPFELKNTRRHRSTT